MYKTIKISAGEGGWGGPLTITPTERSLSSQAVKR